MSTGYAGDVDKAVEAYAAYLENQADALDRVARGCEDGAGYTRGLTREQGDEMARELRDNAGRNRAAAALNRTPQGREHLRVTGLWLAG
ncbi:hypothetical protein [Streptomyces sp. NPDC001889]